MKHISIILAFLLMLSSPVTAQDWDKGLFAYRATLYAEALKEIQPLADGGYVFAQYHLGHMYRNGWGVPQSYKEAFKWYVLAADKGLADAQDNLGNIYQYGEIGVPQSYKKAISWYILAAKQGHASAQYKLGLNYEKGSGVLKDYYMAHMWYNLASSSEYSAGSSAREEIAKKMTSEAIERAQAFAIKCTTSNYKKCGY